MQPWLTPARAAAKLYQIQIGTLCYVVAGTPAAPASPSGGNGCGAKVVEGDGTEDMRHGNQKPEEGGGGYDKLGDGGTGDAGGRDRKVGGK